MWMIEKMVNFITYPIRWFWNMYHVYKEERTIWKIVVLFIVSLSGVLLIATAIIIFLSWLFLKHTGFLIIFGLIIWSYSYVKSKSDFNNVPVEPVSVELQELEEQAKRAYPTVRNIMYQTLKSSAESIGGKIPRLLQEIELSEQHFIIANGICFYQFRLSKADISVRYENDELKEFERILQNDISGKIRTGDFPTVSIEQFIDEYGNFYDAISIDVIEDVDNCFIIQTVLYSPKYAEYLRQKKMNQQNLFVDSSVPEARWDR